MSEDIKVVSPAPEVEKTRYSDEELAEFKAIINEKLETARKEYNTLRKVIMHNGSNDIEDTTPSFKTVEDDGAYQLSKEEASQLAQSERPFAPASPAEAPKVPPLSANNTAFVAARSAR